MNGDVRVKGGATTYLQRDQLNSVRLESDAAGSASRYSYQSYGSGRQSSYSLPSVRYGIAVIPTAEILGNCPTCIQVAGGVAIPSWAWMTATGEVIAGGGPLDPITDAIAIGTLAVGIGAVILHSEQDDKTADRPPTGSKPINETPWSGNHKEIKKGIGSDPDDSVRISPGGDVWGENPDGSWTNHGQAGNFTGSGRASGRRGKDRDRNW